MNSLIAFSNKTEGRDKLCKALQYGSRALKDILQNPVARSKLNGLFIACRDARKIFRLGKSVHEYRAIVETLGNIILDRTGITLHVLARLAYFFYWIFDNLQILGTIKVLERDTVKLSRAAMTAWLIGILLTLVKLVRDLMVNKVKMAKCLASTAGFSQTGKSSLGALEKERTLIYLNVLKNLGDFLPAANGAGLTKMLFQKTISEKWVGLGGLLSALISCYQAWP